MKNQLQSEPTKARQFANHWKSSDQIQGIHDPLVHQMMQDYADQQTRTLKVQVSVLQQKLKVKTLTPSL